MSSSKNTEQNSVQEKQETTTVDQANSDLMRYLLDCLYIGKGDLEKLSSRLQWKDSLLTILNVIMFGVGILLTLMPIISYWRDPEISSITVFAGGLGAVEIIALWLVNPMQRIHQYLGDMAQIVLILTGFLDQIGLRLIECKLDNRPTIGKAADHIQKLTEESNKLIEKYYEDIPTSSELKQILEEHLKRQEPS